MAVSDQNQPWFKSPLFVGAMLTAGGFGLMTLLYFLVSVWLLK